MDGPTPPRAHSLRAGKYVCVMLMVDQPEDKQAISFSYSRFREFYHLKPRTQIARKEVATGAQPTGTVGDHSPPLFQATASTSFRPNYSS